MKANLGVSATRRAGVTGLRNVWAITARIRSCQCPSLDAISAQKEPVIRQMSVERAGIVAAILRGDDMYRITSVFAAIAIMLVGCATPPVQTQTTRYTKSRVVRPKAVQRIFRVPGPIGIPANYGGGTTAMVYNIVLTVF
jgi:hypothetical protein